MMGGNARIECGLMRLEQRPLIGFLVNPFGLTAKAVELDGSSLRVFRRRRIEVISLQAVSAAPSMRRGLVASRLVVPVADAADIVLKGARGGEIAPFAAHINEAWIRVTLEALESARPRIDRLLAEMRGLAKAKFYPAACLIEPLLTEARVLDVGVLSKLSHEAVSAAEMKKIAPIRKFTADPKTARDTAIEKFVSAELEQWKEFFDTIESQPLTKEQRLAVVVDEDATLVLAGAGSGKTSVIATKASYLVKAEIRAPEEILLLAFAKKAAGEMTERLKKHDVPIEASTFHGLGNHIIGKVEGSKPVVAAHASDDFALYDLIKNILHELVHQLTEVSKIIIDWFAHYLVMPKTKWDFESKREYHAYMEEQDLRTLQGESVKSYEELQIANWLYENGIEYEYEPKYEHKIPADGQRDYQPDFRLKESDIYIEHFGVRRDKEAKDDMNKWRTAPYINRKEYIEGIEWKRGIHAEYETHLIETFSDELQDGNWQATLREKLKRHNVTFNPRDEDKIYDRVVEMGQVNAFTKLLGTFLRKFKNGNYTIEDCEENAKNLNLGKRGQAFLKVFAPVYEKYQEQLGEKIDFEDMLSRAAGYVEADKYISPFHHILIDEFQDMTQSQARLIKALKAQHPQTRIFAVGDDWQSIFRFAGADIHLMRDFGAEFGGSFDGAAGVREVDLGQTFRSVDKIADAARKFVLENPDQIRKQVASNRTTTKPAIKIIFSPDKSEGKYIEVLKKLSAQAEVDNKRASVFLLRRYSVPKLDLLSLRRRFPNLQIDFKTIHGSKGLEADHVILLNADRGGNGRRGFPSEINDDALLSLVSAKEEAHPHSEERRVMYVAMTRARESLTILASKAHPSAFVTELKDDPEYDIAHDDDADEDDHKCGECGGRLLKIKAQKDGRIWYRCEYKLCENFLPACPKCETGQPRQTEDSEDLQCSCGATYLPCPVCDGGWLIERDGPYGPFLSCARPPCPGKVNFKKTK